MTKTSAETENSQNLWVKCPSCDQIIYKKELEDNFKICPKCSHYLRMSARERVEMFVDRGTGDALVFEEMDTALMPQDPLGFDGHAGAHPVPTAVDGEKEPHKKKTQYLSKLISEQRKTGRTDAIICGTGKMGGHPVVLAVMDFDFMGGSMGSVVGEKVTRAIEKALETRTPLIIVSASGGARMQEGILSLMQMAKCSAALAALHVAGILMISVLCDPTTGGVTASYSMLGDIHIAEPKALIAFAGPRVIEQTIHQKLPEGFQQSEFLLKHGMVDCIVERKNLKAHLVKLLTFFAEQK